MLSSVTPNCQVTKIVMNPGSQFSELLSVSQLSQVTGIVFVIVIVFVFAFVIVFLLAGSYLLIILIECCKGHKSLGSLHKGGL